MDRIQELNDILNEPIPPALEQSVKRAKARYKKSRVGRWCGIPVASLAGVAALFILLVNTSVPFALACGNIPFLKELAAAVALSPSLKAAVENDYVQLVDDEQTVNGVKLRIEYIIADRRQVNIFYSLTYDGGGTLYAQPEITGTDGERIFSSGFGGAPGAPSGELRQTTVNFFADNAPPALRFSLSVREGGYEHGALLAEFTADLALDPRFVQAGNEYEVDHDVLLDGQSVTVERLEVYPTHAGITVSAADGNSAKLVGLELALVDGEGRRVEAVRNGVSASGIGGEETTYYLESNYFWFAKHLSIEISGATWLDSGRETVTLDIENAAAASPLPEGVTLRELERVGKNVRVVLSAPMREDDVMYSVASHHWLDGAGGERSINAVSSTDSEQEGYFDEEFYLLGCPWDSVELGMTFSRRTAFETPITLPVK